MKHSEYLNRMESLFLALGDKTRLRILNLIRGGEVSVWFFTEVLNESQPKISRHLAYLRNAGVVRTRRDGKWIYYSIIGPDDPLELAILQNLIDSMDEQPELAVEYESLQRLLAIRAEQELEEYEVRGSEIDEFLL
jgi:ArsR family transcriptional regulator